MEGKQFVVINSRRREENTRRKMGLKYKSCKDEKGDSENKNKGASKSSTYASILAKKCGRYLSDRWNILDLITLVIYIFTFLLRVITWASSTSVTNNRALVIAGYLYGLNTMFLTLRAFGHVMETIKGVGVIQIALFHIIGDIATIFWQFIATILAFSIAMTKVYVAEKSYLVKENQKQDLACKSSGISCWWAMAKHLCWSLLGIAELEPLDSVDSPSVTLAQFLFGAFLVMGVILLINMMIALLSNTYQRVQDNSLMEWSYKKAITIQTYSAYHPVPVPLNLISCFWPLCQKCMACCRPQTRDDDDEEDNAEARRKSLDAVVKNLLVTYIATYGNSFPVTDNSKMNLILQETKRNQQMANQIAYRTFTTHAFDQGTLPLGQEAWDTKGVAVDGCLLTCQGEETCGTCKEHGPVAYHGARYRVPFSPDFPHFKVLIQESEEKRFMGIGVVWQNYGSHIMPGRERGTVGYLVDEGKIFGPCQPFNPTVGKEYDQAIAYRGDVIGCTVKFDDKTAVDDKVQIVFTLNGKQITQDEIFMEYNPFKKLYPYICMGHTGMKVLAKMSSSKIDEPQLITKGITSITEATNNIKQTVNSNLDKVHSMFSRLEFDLSKSQDEVEQHLDNVISELEVLDNFIQGRFQQGMEEMQRMEGLEKMTLEELLPEEALDLECNPSYRIVHEDTIYREHQQYLCTQDGEGLPDLQPTTGLLANTHNNLENVQNATKDRFTSVFQQFETLEEKAREDIRKQQNKVYRIQRKLCQLQELAKSLHKVGSGHSRPADGQDGRC